MELSKKVVVIAVPGQGRGIGWARSSPSINEEVAGRAWRPIAHEDRRPTLAILEQKFTSKAKEVRKVFPLLFVLRQNRSAQDAHVLSESGRELQKTKIRREETARVDSQERIHVALALAEGVNNRLAAFRIKGQGENQFWCELASVEVRLNFGERSSEGFHAGIHDVIWWHVFLLLTSREKFT